MPVYKTVETTGEWSIIATNKVDGDMPDNGVLVKFHWFDDENADLCSKRTKGGGA